MSIIQDLSQSSRTLMSEAALLPFPRNCLTDTWPCGSFGSQFIDQSQSGIIEIPQDRYYRNDISYIIQQKLCEALKLILTASHLRQALCRISIYLTTSHGALLISNQKPSPPHRHETISIKFPATTSLHFQTQYVFQPHQVHLSVRSRYISTTR